MRLRRYDFLKFVPAFALWCFLPFVLFPQTSGSASSVLRGTITDPSGRAISGAKISVEAIGSNTGGASANEATSGDDGRFELPLTPGRYRISVARISFAKYEREVNVSGGATQELQVSLALEPLSSSVVVTAESTPVESNAATTQVDVVTRAEIDHRELNSLPDLLATLPGFSLARTGREGGQATIFLDGGNSNYTKVLIDGAPANDSGGFIDVSDFTLDSVDKIEVVHGAESALYGSDAMAGVVQIFTHRGATRAPELDLTGEGGSFDTGRGSAQVSGLIDAFDYSVGANYFSTNGQGANDRFLNRGLNANFGWKIREGNTLRLSLRDNSSFAGTPGQTLFLPPDLGSSAALHNFYASLIWEAQLGQHWLVHVNGNEASLHTIDSDFPFFTSTSQFNRASIDAQTSYLVKQGAFTAGYYGEIENGFPAALGGEHAQRRNQAGFLDARWQLRKRFTLNAGARAEDNAGFGTRVVPRAGISYVAREGGEAIGATRLHAFYGQGIDEPRLDQSFGTDPCFPGNPNLQPEESRTGSAGIEQHLASDRVRVTADYFYDQFRNVISFASFLPTASCPFGVGTFFNTDLARSRGARFTAETRLRSWLTIAGHYTYDDTRVLRAPNAFDPSEIPGNRLLRRPVNSGTIEINAALKRFDFNLVGYITGQRTDSDFLGLGFTRNPGYSRFDVAGTYRVDRRMSVFVRAGNVLDKQYQEALGFPALGREVRGGLKLKFGGE
ncbi:MAG TPA: TonB-dependent receptor [Candidatus Acidoferrales bacterium]|nr:TonB-dependent receptor [Candidatus Acidoferrales bacterium]